MKKQTKHEFTLEKAQSGKYKIVDDNGTEYKFVTYIEDADEDWQVVLMNLTTKKPCCYTVDGRISVQSEKPFFHLIEEVKTHTYWVGVFATKQNHIISTVHQHKSDCMSLQNPDLTLIYETTFEA